jgi:hypothetical protein
MLRWVVLLACSLSGCGGSTDNWVDPMPVDAREQMGRCDPHEGPPRYVPDFVAESFGRIDATERKACWLQRVARGQNGVVFPPPAAWTAEDIASACAVTQPECAAVCEAALSAEVALRLFRRVQEGSSRVYSASSITPTCGSLIAAAPDTLEGDRARELWACLGAPLPERVEATMTLANDASGTRRVVDLRVRAAFVPTHVQASPSQVHELVTVEVDYGCDIVKPRLTLVGADGPRPSLLDDVCTEFQDDQCQAYCADPEGTQCSFVRVRVAP